MDSPVHSEEAKGKYLLKKKSVTKPRKPADAQRFCGTGQTKRSRARSTPDSSRKLSGRAPSLQPICRGAAGSARPASSPRRTTRGTRETLGKERPSLLAQPSGKRPYPGQPAAPHTPPYAAALPHLRPCPEPPQPPLPLPHREQAAAPAPPGCAPELRPAQRPPLGRRSPAAGAGLAGCGAEWLCRRDTAGPGGVDFSSACFPSGCPQGFW